MDVTPRELRDTDIREGFRGYHRDDVDELLERAASTVEGLTERVRQLTERLSSAEGSAGKSRETGTPPSTPCSAMRSTVRAASPAILIVNSLKNVSFRTSTPRTAASRSARATALA